MKGFEIQINGGAPIVIAAEHYAFALLGCVNGEEQGRLTLMGGNLTERFTWWMVHWKMAIKYVSV